MKIEFDVNIRFPDFPAGNAILDELGIIVQLLTEVKDDMATIDEKLDSLADLTKKVYDEGKANQDTLAALRKEIDDLKAGGATPADLERWAGKLNGVLANTSALDALNPDAAEEK